MPQPDANHLDVAGRRIAYRKRAGDLPTLLFLPGYASDMDGNKAAAIDAFAERMGIAMVRFDYSGTGLSDGEFDQGTLDRWLDEAFAVIDQLTEGPVVLIGSSMGGWIALHLALRRPDRVQALVGIAAAPDFTEWDFRTRRGRCCGGMARRGPATTTFGRLGPSGNRASRCGCWRRRSLSIARFG
jgi:pimeloyl-ACP methyl ester carboxylesterase